MPGSCETLVDGVIPAAAAPSGLAGAEAAISETFALAAAHHSDPVDITYGTTTALSITPENMNFRNMAGIGMRVFGRS